MAPSHLLPAVLLACLGCSLQPSVQSAAAADVPPIGLNLSGVRDYSSEYPFIDVFHSARAWVPQQAGQPWGKGPKLELREDGYPARLAPGQFATTIVLNARGYPTGTYTLLYDGRGRIRLERRFEIVREEAGRIEFRVDERPNCMIHLEETDPADPLRNIRLYMPGQEAAGEAGRLFAQPFLDRCRKFACLRFMDWMETNNSEIEGWGERPEVDDFSWALHGVPAEVMIDLANAVQCDAWFCMPHRADEEYVRQFAELVRDRLDPELTAYVEHSNELWNGQFAQAREAGDAGTRARLSSNRYQAQLLHHGQRTVSIGRTWDEVLGDERVRVVLGAQSVNPWTTEQGLSVDGADEVIEAVAIAPYFGNALGGPDAATASRRMSPAQIAEECRRLIREQQSVIARQAELARSRGMTLIAYEGGQHLVGTRGMENDEQLTAAFHAANRSPEMGELYVAAVESWAEAGGGLWVAFASVSTPSKWGSWGLKEYDDQPVAEAPKWRSIEALLERSAEEPRR